MELELSIITAVDSVKQHGGQAEEERLGVEHYHWQEEGLRVRERMCA